MNCHKYLRMIRSILRGACLLFALFVLAWQGTALAQEPLPDDLVRSFKQNQEAGRVPALSFVEGGSEPMTDAIEPAQLDGYDPADWTLMAFSAPMEQSWEIFTTRSDGREIARLTNDGASDVRPALNRDGSEVAFSSDRTGNMEIFVMGSKGGPLQQLTNHGAADDFVNWFPNLDKLVFSSQRDGKWEVYAINRDGTGEVRISYDQTKDDVYPAVSPDGAQIAWIKRDGSMGQIWLMNPDGSNPRPVGPACKYMQHIYWVDAKNILYDCDMTGDELNDIIEINIDAPSPTPRVPSHPALTEYWIGGAPTLPAGGYARMMLAVQVQYEIVDQTVRVKTFQTQVRNEWGQVLKAFSLAIGGAWQKTDWIPPITSVSGLPPVTISSAGIFNPQLNYQGTDEGGAGLAAYQVLYRRNGGEWQMAGRVAAQNQNGSLQFQVQTGDEIELKTLGIDFANNIEIDAGKTPIKTLLYRGQLLGRVRDRQGYPIADATVQGGDLSATPITDWEGAFSTYIKSQRETVVEISHSAFASKNFSVTVPYSPDALIDTEFVLFPKDDILQDGGFEQTQLLDWTPESTSDVAITTVARQAGRQGLFVGKNASLVKSIVELANNNQYGSSQFNWGVAVDANATAHTIWTHVQKGVQYQACNGNDCTPAQTVTSDRPFKAVIRAHNQTVGIAWTALSGISTEIYYASKQGSNWLVERVIGAQSILDFDLIYDANGVPYIFWSEDFYDAQNQGALHSVLKSITRSDGNWGAPNTIITSPANSRYHRLRALADPNFGLHLFFLGAELVYMNRDASGTWSTPETAVESAVPGSIRSYDVALGTEGTIHVVFDDAAIFYVQRTADGWSAVEFVKQRNPNTETSVHLSQLSEGQLILENDDGALYRREGDGRWFGPGYSGAPILERVNYSKMVATQQGSLVLMTSEAIIDQWNNLSAQSLYLRTVSLVTETAGRAQISRRFTVPTDLYGPTLFLAAKFQSEMPTKNSDTFFIEVSASPEFSPTVEVSRTVEVTQPEDWRDYAVPLLPWQGKEITLTVGVDAVADDVFSWLLLDDMQIGSWNTPKIIDVSVPDSQRERGRLEGRIVVSGTNFLPGAQIFVNDAPVNDVRWLNSGALEGQLPAGLLPGRYDTVVQNPGNVRAILPSSLQSGIPVFLPLLERGVVRSRNGE